MERRSKAVILFVLSAILWSFGGLFIKMVPWNPMAISGMRSLIAMAVMLLYVRRLDFSPSPAGVGAAVAYAVTVTLFVVANKLTTAANAILLQYTAPIYVAILSARFLGEKIRWSDWLSIFAIVGGIALFFLDRLSIGNIIGNLLALASGISFALLVLFLRKQKSESPLHSVIHGNLLTALAGIPFMFQSFPSASSWIFLLLLGIFQLGLSYILYAEAIRSSTAIDAILIPSIEPVLNPVWVYLVLGEKPGRWALAGGIIVFSSATLRGLIAAKRKEINAWA